ncbi:hypothetical protein PAXRUDRAFT_166615 [Paxillus rubicundulus Ve08.2h10]|uniref:Uncharacterized protein n=1 Tax=Paxillus rubicundulus Ve08.2h10 TaxID=930991 RepID=A0A0D0DHK4_9AGAM|nr:hypothetical protein PAXRUDRAFT_166615 [Paxillus rubicundulus Ve08.2h10]
MSSQYLARFLRQLLRFLTSISTHRPTSLLLAFLAFLRRQLFRRNTNTGSLASHHCQVQYIHPSTTQDESEKAICAMSAPSRKSPEPQHGGRSPVDAPYDMSSSGHLIPYSPTPSRRYTQEHISYISGSQNPLHEEPNPIDPESMHPMLHSMVQSIGPRPSILAYEGDHKQSSDHPNLGIRIPSPLQSTPAFPPSLPGPYSDSPIYHTPSALGVHELHGGAGLEPPRSKSPQSIMSTSQASLSYRSVRSDNSALSIGRASYRQHHGLPPRGRTPTPSIGQDRSVLVTGSSVTLGRAAPDSSSATPGRLVALPNVDDPNQPGEPTVDYHRSRFVPMSTHGVLRYHRHKQRNVIRRPTEPNHTIGAMLYEFPETQYVSCRYLCQTSDFRSQGSRSRGMVGSSASRGSSILHARGVCELS